MTKEQGEALAKYEGDFGWAIHQNFVRLNQEQFNEIARYYKDILGVGLSRSQMTCSTCRLKTMKALGEEYFKWKEEMANEAQNSPVQPETEAEGITTPTKEKMSLKSIIRRVGRPRKIDLNEDA